MKIYSIQQFSKNWGLIGIPVLTASETTAKAIKKEWLKQNPELISTIFTYEVKTQGKNFDLYALPSKYKE